MPPVIFHRLVPALLSMVRFGVGLLFFSTERKNCGVSPARGPSESTFR
jgi:hypothetical protein